MPKQAAQPHRVQPNRCIAIFRIVFMSELRSSAQRPHCSKCPRVRKARVGRKRRHRSAIVSAEGIRLVLPIEIMRTRANRMIGVLRSLVIGEKALRFFVQIGGLGIVQYAGEEACHSPIRWKLLICFKSLLISTTSVALITVTRNMPSPSRGTRDRERSTKPCRHCGIAFVAAARFDRAAFES